MVIEYHNAEDAPVRAEFANLIEDIEKRGLLYPVTVVDGVLLYDGAVSYPAIMRAVGSKIDEREASKTADA